MLQLKTSSQYTIAGIVFGMLFPIVATVGLSIEHEWTLIETQLKAGWLLWIINSAPFFLGIFARSAGMRQEELEKLNKAREEISQSQQAYREALAEFLTLKALRNNKSPLLLGFLTFVLLSLVSISYLNVVRLHEKEELRRYVEGRAQSTVKLFHYNLNERMLALDRMARRFETPSEKNKINWISDARAYAEHFLGLEATVWVNKDNTMSWYYPENSSKHEKAIMFGKEQFDEAMIKHQAPSGEVCTYTDPVLLNNGEVGFVSVHGTGRSGNSGYIMGIFNAKKVFSQLLDERFKIAVFSNSHRLYSQGFTEGELDINKDIFDFHDQYSFYQLWVHNIHYRIYIGATPELAQIFRDQNVNKIFAFLLFISFFIGLFVTRHYFVHQKVRSLLSEVDVTRSALDEVAAVSYTDLNGLILNANEKFFDLTGLSREQVIGKDYRRISFSLASENFISALWTQVINGRIWNGEIMNEAEGGYIYWVYTSIVPKKDSSGLIAGFTAISIDITEKKKAEEEILEARSAAENALMTKSRFIANMSHEIRTPMNGIVGITTLMLSEYKDRKIQKNLKVIKSSCETLHAIVDDILDFSKLEAGKNQVERIPFNLVACIQDVCNLLQTEALQKSIRIETNISSQMPEWVIGDRVKISQVITNLAGNAIKFTQQGAVSITASAIDGNDKSFTAQISIRDSGIGIPAEVLSKLFKSFSQVDASTTRKFGGTGLGLAISKGLVELMGGQIWVESKEGDGSTFTFTVPMEKSAGEEEVQESYFDVKLAKRNPLRILVAEDNQTNQMVISKFLEKFGYSADLASNGFEVLESLEDKTYDLIFMDCHMPILDGFEATQEIVKKYEKRPRIVALTASSMEIDRKRCIEAGMDDFLSKPITPSKIMEKLSNIASTTSHNSDRSYSNAEKPDKNTLINIDTIRIEYDGEDDILLKLVLRIQQEIPKYMDELRLAIDKDDYEKIKFCAHTFKGVISNLYVEPMIATLEKIENIDASSVALDLSAILHELDKMSEQLIQELQSFFPAASSAA